MDNKNQQSKKGGSGKIIVVLIVLAVLAAIYFIFAGNTSDSGLDNTVHDDDGHEHTSVIDGQYFVQLASFDGAVTTGSSDEAVQSFLSGIDEKYNRYVIRADYSVDDTTYYRVAVGPYATEQEAEDERLNLLSAGFSGAFVKFIEDEKPGEKNEMALLLDAVSAE